VKSDNSFYIGKNLNDAEFLFLRILPARTHVEYSRFQFSNPNTKQSAVIPHRVHVPPAPRVTNARIDLASEANICTHIQFHLLQNAITMQQLFRFLHFLVTLIFSLLINFQYYFKLTRRKIRGVLYNSQECDIKNGVATLKNLPRHLTFIVMEKDVDLCILAKLVVWSVTAGISYISIQASEGKTRIGQDKVQY
jgi:hypothetical protein